MKTLVTDRLILRKFCEGDLEDFYEYAKNPNVGPNAGWKPHEKIEDTAAILKSFIEKEEVWAIVYKSTGKVIGSMGLHKDNKRDNENVKMLGYVLSEAYRGRGLTTEAAKEVIRFAFEELGLDLISIFHYPFNKRSKRVIEKCGFKYEGTLRLTSTIYDGSVYDDVCYSMTRQEFLGIKG